LIEKLEDCKIKNWEISGRDLDTEFADLLEGKVE
jgi:hypothetical protein